MNVLAGIPSQAHADDFRRLAGDVRVDWIRTAESAWDKLRERGNRERYDAAAISAEWFRSVYPWDWMPLVRELCPEGPVAVALSEAGSSSVMMDVIAELAVGLHFHLLPVGDADAGLGARLAGALFGPVEEGSEQRGGRLVGVMSCGGKDGATTVVLNAGLHLARTTGLRIGLLDLNLKAPELKDLLNAASPGRCFFHLRPGCSSGSLTEADLRAQCVPVSGLPNLHLLAGSSRRDTACDVTPDEIRVLLETARRAFDLVIADVNACPDNAATVFTMRSADERWLVAQPLFTSYRSGWGDWFDCFWKYGGVSADRLQLIVNRWNWQTDPKPERIAGAMGMKLLGALSVAPGEAGRKAANEGIPLIDQPGCGPFAEEIAELANGLAERCGVVPACVEAAAANKSGRISRLLASVFS